MRARRLLTRAARARLFGELDEATALVDKALSLDPESELAQTLLTELLPREGRLEEAIERLEGLLCLGAPAPRVRLRLAACLMEAGRSESALSHLDALTTSADTNIEDHVDRLRVRAQALLALERFDDAVEVLRAYRELDQGHPVVSALAHALERSGQPERARTLRRSLTRFRPDDWSPFLHTLDEGERASAAQVLDAPLDDLMALPPAAQLSRLNEQTLAATLRPLPAPVRAAVHGHVHRLAEHRDAARTALARAEDHPIARFETALLDMCADTIERAVEALEGLVEEDLPLPGLRYWRAVAHHAAGHDQRAASLYGELVEAEPDHGHAHWLLADVAEHLAGMDGEAAYRAQLHRTYRATPLLLHRPLRDQLHTIVGVAGRVRLGQLDAEDPARVRASARAGDHAQARDLLHGFAKHSDLDETTRIALAREGLNVEAYAAVIDLLRPMVEHDHPSALALSGEAMVLSGKPVLGAERLRRATDADPTLVRAWDFLGVVHAQRAEWSEAEQPLREAVRRGPDGPERQRNLAALLMDTGRGAEAVAPAESALAMMAIEPSTLALLARAYEAAGDVQWAALAGWARDHHQEQALHRQALGGLAGMLPSNVERPPDVFRPTFGRFHRRLEQIAAALPDDALATG